MGEPKIIDTGPRNLGMDVLIGSIETHKFVNKIEDLLEDGVSCWRSDQVERRGGSEIEGRGLFAKEPIEAGEVVAIKGGRIVNEAEIRKLTAEGIIHGSQQQIGVDAFLVGLTPDEDDANLVGYNHSCDSNAFAVLPEESPIALLVARRPIEAGEEIKADYSVSNVSDTHRFLCNCGAANCRVIVQPHYDFLHKSLQEKYKGEFLMYVQRLIDDLEPLPKEEREGILLSARYGELAGRIVVLAGEIKRRQGLNPDDKRIVVLQQLLLIQSALFVSIFPYVPAGKFEINRKSAKKFQKSVRDNLSNIASLAQEIDDKYGWKN